MPLARETLRRLGEILLSPKAEPGQLLEAARSLHDLLLQQVAGQISPRELDQETQLPSGVAIAPSDAMRCILDFTRTAGFLRGVEHAVRDMRGKRPGRPVEVLYAGCGPLAPLVVPIAEHYEPSAVQFTLLEINPGALASAQLLFERLGLLDRVREFNLVDAAEYCAPPGRTWDVCVVEVLQKALSKEPQLAVTAQLVPQLAEDGILIPQRITVSAALADLGKEFQLIPAEGDPESEFASDGGRERLPLAILLELDRQSAPQLLCLAEPDIEGGGSFLPLVEVEIPQTPGGSLTPILRTTIQVADGIILDDYDSGLTIPEMLHHLGAVAPGVRLSFRYGLGENPGFIVRRLD